MIENRLRTPNILLRSRKIAATIGFAAIGVVGLWSLTIPQKSLSSNLADGRYSSSRCGTIIFSNGSVSWGGAKVDYTLDTDKSGMFALTEYLVDVKSTGPKCLISSDQSKSPLKLRFDSSDNPKIVTLWDVDKSVTVDFFRRPT